MTIESPDYTADSSCFRHFGKAPTGASCSWKYVHEVDFYVLALPDRSSTLKVLLLLVLSALLRPFLLDDLSDPLERPESLDEA